MYHVAYSLYVQGKPAKLAQSVNVSDQWFRIHVDVMTGDKLSSIFVAISPVMYWSFVHPVGRGGNWVKEVRGPYFSPLQFSLY